MNIQKNIRAALSWLGGLLQGLGARLYETPSEKHLRRVRPWNAMHGDQTLRVEYPLNSDSLVIDVGGYEGQWASDIFSRYACTIYVFEPVASFAANIQQRFAHNKKIHVYAFGLSNQDRTDTISFIGDQSSTVKKAGSSQPIQLKQASALFKQQNIKSIDLIKMNIEGGEYELLEDLIQSGFVKQIRNIQVQFHDFFPEAESRMHAIQKQLEQTHELTYQFPFVWENWRRRT